MTTVLTVVGIGLLVVLCFYLFVIEPRSEYHDAK